MQIEYGYCHCGCGNKTNAAPYNLPAKGIKKGDPQKYILGHNVVGTQRASAETFWAKVAKGPVDSCWEWQAQKMKTDKFHYGKMMYQKKRQLAHRLAWFFTYGEIPEGMAVLHKCDNPPCCNPSHLFLGTLKDNFNDMAAKGRSVLPRGQRKLSSDDVTEIRRLHHVEGLSGAAISKRYDVGHSYVCRVISGKARKR